MEHHNFSVATSFVPCEDSNRK